MTTIRNSIIALSALLSLVCVSCGTGGKESGKSTMDFFGTQLGDDSATVVKQLRRNKIVHLDSIRGGEGWMHFMKKPNGYILFDDELWEMVSVCMTDGKMKVVRFTNAYPTRQDAEKEYRAMARRLSRHYPLRMTSNVSEDFVILKCIAAYEQGGLNFALTNGKSISGHHIYNVVLEFY